MESQQSQTVERPNFLTFYVFDNSVTTDYTIQNDPKEEGFGKHSGKRRKCYQHFLLLPKVFCSIEDKNPLFYQNFVVWQRVLQLVHCFVKQSCVLTTIWMTAFENISGRKKEKILVTGIFYFSNNVFCLARNKSHPLSEIGT